MEISDRALIILTCYDFESLQITLKSLEHTLNRNEKVVIILNGINTLASAMVERISRTWANTSPEQRFVVKPLCAGAKAFYAIAEVLANYEPLKGVNYICKIDDDIIPLKKGWMHTLAEGYIKLSEEGPAGFTTGLINNNCWGFNELLDIFNKRDDYKRMFNYPTRGNGARKYKMGEVNNDFFGTVWQEPYLAWWIHELSSLQIESFISKTDHLSQMEIPFDVGYSIGCLFFEKHFWLTLDPLKYNSIVDEQLVHYACLNERKKKWAFMNEPMIHLFYFNQRLPNRDILGPVIESLSTHFSDDSFKSIARIDIDELIINLNESFKTLNDEFTTFLKSMVEEASTNQNP